MYWDLGVLEDVVQNEIKSRQSSRPQAPQRAKTVSTMRMCTHASTIYHMENKDGLTSLFSSLKAFKGTATIPIENGKAFVCWRV